MKQTFFFALLCALSFAFYSCDSMNNEIEGKSFKHVFSDYEYSDSYITSTYEFYKRKKCAWYYYNSNGSDFNTDYYYELKNNVIYIYNDKKMTDLVEQAEYHGDYITMDGVIYKED